jgi:hypothetical protein
LSCSLHLNFLKFINHIHYLIVNLNYFTLKFLNYWAITNFE